MLDKSGKIANVVIGVGGFLGMGEHDVAVNFDRLKWSDTSSTTGSAKSSTAKEHVSRSCGARRHQGPAEVHAELRRPGFC